MAKVTSKKSSDMSLLWKISNFNPSALLFQVQTCLQGNLIFATLLTSTKNTIQLEHHKFCFKPKCKFMSWSFRFVKNERSSRCDHPRLWINLNPTFEFYFTVICRNNTPPYWCRKKTLSERPLLPPGKLLFDFVWLSNPISVLFIYKTSKIVIL